MRTAAPLPLDASGFGRRFTLITRRIAAAGEQTAHAARTSHAVGHASCRNRVGERRLSVTCNYEAWSIIDITGLSPLLPFSRYSFSEGVE